jgi:hypothetical protein
MTAAPIASRSPSHRTAELLVLAAAALIAVVSARNYAGSWNDGSRLATVEALVDYHTLAIDESIFVNVPPARPASPGPPYPPDEAGLLARGTQDKLFINGHFYSDKSPVPALLMAGMYQALQWGTGLTAREHPGWFCYAMTVLSSGLAYVVAVSSIFRLGRVLGLGPSRSSALTASFALATVSLPYVRQVNNHILLLGATAALLPGLVRMARAGHRGPVPAWRTLKLGSLAGLGYTIDLGAGPVLLAATLALMIYRCRRPGPVAGFLLGALPWLALHHAVNYAVGGTWKPANAVPEYFTWPGCPFDAKTLTGAWNHPGLGHFLTYAAALLAGKRGFLGYNLPVFLALPAAVVLLRRPPAELPEVLWAGFCCGGTWLAYALTSTNYSGLCCSVRWFVPLLAPAYLVLAVLLRRHPRYTGDFLVLSGWGAVVAGLAWWQGPWLKHLVPGFWPLQAAALLCWAWYRNRSQGSGVRDQPQAAA